MRKIAPASSCTKGKGEEGRDKSQKKNNRDLALNYSVVLFLPIVLWHLVSRSTVSVVYFLSVNVKNLSYQSMCGHIEPDGKSTFNISGVVLEKHGRN